MFSLMSRSRFDKRKTAVLYGCFGIVLAAAACVWYVVDWSSCAKMSALVMYLCFAAFSVYISADSIGLCIYKLALNFYLLAVFLVSAIEISIIYFHRNVWADILLRILIITLMALLIDRKVKETVRNFSSYLEKELDGFSVTIMVISILFGIGFILNPDFQDQTPFHLFQIFMNFFLTGALQMLVFRLYLHIGREKEYQKENQLMKMNQRLLESQVEFLEDSVEDSRRIRHDMRHHNAVIAEYIRQGQAEEALQYLAEHRGELDENTIKTICANTAVNNLLAAYTRKAEREQIHVTLDVQLEKNLSITGTDLVTILANAYENAIYGCMEAEKESPGRKCLIQLIIKRKKNKLAIYCSNTCRKGIEMKNGQPRLEATGGVGVLSIIKTAEKYEGEYDFKNDNGVFIFRLVMNIPSD